VAIAPDGCDIVINATSLGLRADDPLPFPVDGLPVHAAVAEVVMQPLMTPLLRAAQARGLRIVTGDGMLTAQLPFWMDFVGFERSRAGDAAAHREAAVDG
jgi:shikimate dehydrogenase